MDLTRTPGRPCPYCGYTLNAATPAKEGEPGPSPGDISLCFNCGEILVIDEGLVIREPTPEELERAEKIPNLDYWRRKIGVFRRVHGPAKRGGRRSP
jgi:hypothetical protein